MTFDGTAGGLRSDHIYAIFEDREGVIWFGTDRGVCRFDPHAPRVESIGDNSDSNFVRALFQTTDGRTFAGTNRGLFVYDSDTKAWLAVTELGRNIIYSISEDKQERLLVASASGFYVAANKTAKPESLTFTRIESSSGTADAAGSVRAVTQFRGSTYFAIYGRGVEHLDNARSSLAWPNAISSNREVISLLADGDSRLLIGTARDGVFTSDGKTIETNPLLISSKDQPFAQWLELLTDPCGSAQAAECSYAQSRASAIRLCQTSIHVFSFQTRRH